MQTVEARSQCAICSFTSDVAGLFHLSWLTGRYFCLKCWAKRAGLVSLLQFGATAAVLLAACWLLSRFYPKGIGPLLFWLILFVAFEPLWTMIHELGHASCARIVGCPVYAINIGTGNSVFNGSLGGVKLSVSAIPLGGQTYCALPDLKWPRLRLFLVYLGGPSADFLMLVLVLRLAIAEVPSELLPLFAVIGFGCLLSLLNSLVPRRVLVQGAYVQNDGLALLTIPSADQPATRSWHAEYYIHEGAERFERKDYGGALEWYERGLKFDAENEPLRYCCGLALCFLCRYAEARQRWLESLLANKIPQEVQPVYMNNVAFADLLLCLQGAADANDRLKEAGSYSQEALKRKPRDAYIQGTRGAVLAVRSPAGHPELDEGASLLEKAFEKHAEPAEKSICASFLALSSARKGDMLAAHRHLEVARCYDADSDALRTVGQELARLEAS